MLGIKSSRDVSDKGKVVEELESVLMVPIE
jgi:hypothetical protein